MNEKFDLAVDQFTAKAINESVAEQSVFNDNDSVVFNDHDSAVFNDHDSAVFNDHHSAVFNDHDSAVFNDNDSLNDEEENTRTKKRSF